MDSVDPDSDPDQQHCFSHNLALSADGKNRVLFYWSLGSEAGDWHGLSVCLLVGESVHDL